MYKEIVTKTVIGKLKKTFRNNYEVITTDLIDNVLGCWVINNKMEGTLIKDKVIIKGSFDVNIWYSFDENTKTNVEVTKVEYEETVDVKVKEEVKNKEVLLSKVKEPTVVDVKVNNNIIKYEIEKEIGIEIIGDDKVKIQIVSDSLEEYEDLNENDEIDRIVDEEVNTDYLQNS